jgi:hypothetical protein
MRQGSSVRAASRPGNRDEWPAAGSRRRPDRVAIPWLRRRPPSGCLLDPGGPCALLSALVAAADTRAALDDLVEAMVADAEARLEGPLPDRVISDERLAEALIVRRTLEQWVARARNRRRRRALAGVAAAVVSSAYAVPLCLLGDAPVRLTVGVAVAVVTGGSALSLLAFLRRTPSGWPLSQLIAGLVCETGVGVLLIVEGAMRRVLVGDEVATLIGLAAAGVSLLVQAVIARLAN